MSRASQLARCCHGLTAEGHLTHSTHPMPYEAAKPPKPIPFRVYDLNSVWPILVNNLILFPSVAGPLNRDAFKEVYVWWDCGKEKKCSVLGSL